MTGWRAVIYAAGAAILSTGAAIAVNLATEWKTTPWIWYAVVGITILSFVLSLWAIKREEKSDKAHAQVENIRQDQHSGNNSTNIQAIGNVSFSAPAGSPPESVITKEETGGEIERPSDSTHG